MSEAINYLPFNWLHGETNVDGRENARKISISLSSMRLVSVFRLHLSHGARCVHEIGSNENKMIIITYTKQHSLVFFDVLQNFSTLKYKSKSSHTYHERNM